MTMKQRLIGAAFRAFRDQDELGRDWFDLGAADEGKTVLDGAYDLGAILDAILAELREPDEGMKDAMYTARKSKLKPGDDPFDRLFTAAIDHIRSGK